MVSIVLIPLLKVSFSYGIDGLQSAYAQQIDTAINLYSGEQYGEEDKNFRVFLDSCPDRWDRLLMKRRKASMPTRYKDAHRY